MTMRPLPGGRFEAAQKKLEAARAEEAIVDAIHAVATAPESRGYDPEIVPLVVDQLLGPDADEDARGRKRAEVARVYERRFNSFGAC